MYCTHRVNGKVLMMEGKRQNWLWALLTLVLIVGVGWYWFGERLVPVDQTDAELRLRSLQQIPDSKTVSLLRTLNPQVKQVEGELVWSNTSQQGMLHIRQLPRPTVGSFYQIWVYDTKGQGRAMPLGALHASQWQDNNYIPLRASNNIQEPYKFVLTLEQEDDGIPEQILVMAQP